MVSINRVGTSHKVQPSRSVISPEPRNSDKIDDSWSPGASASQPVISTEDLWVLVFSVLLENQQADITQLGIDITQGLQQYIETGEFGPLSDFIPEELQDSFETGDFGFLDNILISHAHRTFDTKIKHREITMKMLLKVLNSLNETAKKVNNSIAR